jgi:hypothetical protein
MIEAVAYYDARVPGLGAEFLAAEYESLTTVWTATLQSALSRVRPWAWHPAKHLSLEPT